MQFQNVIKLKFLYKYSTNFPSFVPNSQAVQADIEIDTSYQYLYINDMKYGNVVEQI